MLINIYNEYILKYINMIYRMSETYRQVLLNNLPDSTSNVTCEFKLDKHQQLDALFGRNVHVEEQDENNEVIGEELGSIHQSLCSYFNQFGFLDMNVHLTNKKFKKLIMRNITCHQIDVDEDKSLGGLGEDDTVDL